MARRFMTSVTTPSWHDAPSPWRMLMRRTASHAHQIELTTSMPNMRWVSRPRLPAPMTGIAMSTTRWRCAM